MVARTDYAGCAGNGGNNGTVTTSIPWDDFNPGPVHLRGCGELSIGPTRMPRLITITALSDSIAR